MTAPAALDAFIPHGASSDTRESPNEPPAAQYAQTTATAAAIPATASAIPASRRSGHERTPAARHAMTVPVRSLSSRPHLALT